MRNPTPPLALALAVLLALPAAAQLGPPVALPAPPEDEPGVELRLLADVEAWVPGEELVLAAVLDLRERWHVYWTNPGESGLATRIEVEAPAGFEVGAARFPGPQRFEMAGGITSYGYEGRLVVLVPVKCPAEGPERARFELRASWLACKEVCVLGEGSARFALPRHAGESPPAAANAALLAPWIERMPRPAGELEDLVASWGGSAAQPALELVVAGAEELELFPARDSGFELEDARSAYGDAGARLYLTLAPAPVAPAEGEPRRLRALLRVRRDGSARYYELDLAPPAAGGR